MQNLKSILGWNYGSDVRAAEAMSEKWGHNIENLPINIKIVIDITSLVFYTDMQAMLHTLVMTTSCRNLQNLTILSQMYSTMGLKTHFQACRKFHIEKNENLF